MAAIYCGWMLVSLAACAAPAPTQLVTTPAPGLGPTQFIETRVADILTQTAPTALPAEPSTDVPPAATAVSPSPAAPAATPAAPAETPRPLPTFGATITAQTPEASHTPAAACADQACVTAAEHFWLDRPIPSDYTVSVERTYPYGSTQGGAREPHHGVEFANRSGTPVVAAGAGTVVVAGSDAATAYGPSLDFYGNLVVVQLDTPYLGEPVYTLYGHLQNWVVEAGQHVDAGQALGAVGSSGVAVGPHLHFEVRVGENDYFHSRNPELWLKPLLYDGRPWGVIAGRLVDTEGNVLAEQTVAIRPIDIQYEVMHNHFISTYAHETVNGDDQLQENFAIGDLPLGTYSVTVNTTKPYQQTVKVEAGQITWVNFVVKPPYPTTTP